jgi:hypothetical protein
MRGVTSTEAPEGKRIRGRLANRGPAPDVVSAAAGAAHEKNRQLIGQNRQLMRKIGNWAS